MKKILGIIIGILASLLFPLSVIALNTTVPLASGSGFCLVSTATGQYVASSSVCANGGSASPTWGTITGTISSQTDLQNALNLLVPYSYASSTYYLASNPSNYITLSSLTPYVTFTYASGTFATLANTPTYTYSSSTFVSFPYATGTFLTISNAASTYQPIGSYITNLYASGTFPSFGYGTGTYAILSNTPTYTYASATFPSFTYATNTFETYSYASNTRPTFTYASGTFLTISTAASTYQPIGSYITNTYASGTFPSFGYGTNTYATIASLGSYPTFTYASSTYALANVTPTYTYASSTFASTTWINATFPTFTYASSSYVLASASATLPYYVPKGQDFLTLIKIASSTTGSNWYLSTTTNSITLNIPNASASATGTLSATDWSTFNGKGNGTVTSVGIVPVTGQSASAAITGSGNITLTTNAGYTSSFTSATGTSGTDFNISTTSSSIVFNIPTASASNRGLLSSGDWTTFNNKLSTAVTSVGLVMPTGYTVTNSPVTTTGNLTAAVTAGYIGPFTTSLTKTGTDISLATTSSSFVLNIPVSSGSATGTLNATDWTTFNNKAPTASPTFTGTVTFALASGTAESLSGNEWVIGTSTIGELDILQGNLSRFTRLSASNTLQYWNKNVTALDGTGGTIYHIGGKTIHVFTKSGTFTAPAGGLTNVSTLIVAGGGGGGQANVSNADGGGGGAGGVISSTTVTFAASTAYTVTVGNGGAGNASGASSSINTIATSTGGGAGALGNGVTVAQPGGSGGGGHFFGAGAAGIAGQGNSGASGNSSNSSGQGGGCNGAGIATVIFVNNGCSSTISGTTQYYGIGGPGNGNATYAAIAGAPNTGNGGQGGGGNASQLGGAGGSGIVIISYTTPSATTTQEMPLVSVLDVATTTGDYSIDTFGASSSIYVNNGSVLYLQNGGVTNATLAQSGYFGLGTTSPIAKFTIVSPQMATGTASLYIDGSTNNANSDIVLNKMGFSNENALIWNVGGLPLWQAGVFAGSTNNFSILDGLSRNALTIASTTNFVGISSSSPTTLLSVSGTTTTNFLNAWHIGGVTGTPTVATSTGVGTGAGTTVSITGTDLAGIVNVKTGTAPSVNAVIVNITFNKPYVTAPFCTLTKASSSNEVIWATTTASVLSIESINATALTAASSYAWYYHCLQ